MKKILFVCALVALIGGLSSCKGFGDSFIGTESDLIGCWQDSVHTGSFIVFTTEAVTDSNRTEFAGYKWGKEWNESDGVYEADVDKDRHGNGWFMWKKEPKAVIRYTTQTTGTAVEAANMNLSALNGTILIYTTDSGRQYTFKKKNK